MRFLRSRHLRELSMRLDGELSRRREHRLARRLETDTELQKEYRTLQDLEGMICRLPEPSSLSPVRSEAMRRAVMRRVQEELSQGKSRQTAPRWGGRAAFATWAVSGMLVGWLLLSSLVGRIETRLESARLMQDLQISMIMPLDTSLEIPISPFESEGDDRP